MTSRNQIKDIHSRNKQNVFFYASTKLAFYITQKAFFSKAPLEKRELELGSHGKQIGSAIKPRRQRTQFMHRYMYNSPVWIIKLCCLCVRIPGYWNVWTEIYIGQKTMAQWPSLNLRIERRPWSKNLSALILEVGVGAVETGRDCLSDSLQLGATLISAQGSSLQSRWDQCQTTFLCKRRKNNNPF